MVLICRKFWIGSGKCKGDKQKIPGCIPGIFSTSAYADGVASVAGASAGVSMTGVTTSGVSVVGVVVCSSIYN